MDSEEASPTFQEYADTLRVSVGLGCIDLCGTLALESIAY